MSLLAPAAASLFAGCSNAVATSGRINHSNQPHERFINILVPLSRRLHVLSLDAPQHSVNVGASDRNGKVAFVADEEAGRWGGTVEGAAELGVEVGDGVEAGGIVEGKD